LNHVEYVHRPGERQLVRAFFELLGFEPLEMWNGEVLIGIVDPPTWQDKDNDNYIAGREVRAEQWAFDQALIKALGQEPLASQFAGYKELLATTPQWGLHFGIKFNTIENWEAAVARFKDVDKHAPELSGRVRLHAVFRPDDPEPFSAVCQAFVWTDLISTGSLALGQHIELTAPIS